MGRNRQDLLLAQVGTCRSRNRVGIAAMAAAALLALVASTARATPIREPDPASDKSRMTLIQLPRVSFSLTPDDIHPLGSTPTVMAESAPGEATAAIPPAEALPAVGQGIASEISIGPASGPAGFAAKPLDSGSSVPEPASVVMIIVASAALYFLGRHWSREHAAR